MKVYFMKWDFLAPPPSKNKTKQNKKNKQTNKKT